MKKLFFLAALMGSAALGWSQTTAKPKAPVKAPAKAPASSAPAKPVLKTLNDSASYAMGIGVASFYKQQGITQINTTLLSAAINDVMKGNPTQINEMTANEVMNKVMTQILESKSKGNIDAGNAFLAANAKKAGVKTTASGLQYEIIKEGAGDKPTAIDTFVVHYRGTFINGQEFDASANRGEPLTMPMNQVIRGWTEGLQLMSPGSKYKFYVPYTLGYGPVDYGAIPGGSALIFEIELLDFKKATTR